MRFTMAILAGVALTGCSELGFGNGVANVNREGAALTSLTDDDPTGTDDSTTATGTDDGSGSTGTGTGTDDCDDDDSDDDDTGMTDDDDDCDDDDSSCDDDDDDDDCDDDDDDDSESDLPYDVRLEIGDVFVLTDAFLEEGPAPAAILGVTMDDPQWRYAELTGLAPFTVDQSDCDHEGNRDTGRDRIEVTWQNADGSTETDHLDLRYCGA